MQVLGELWCCKKTHKLGRGDVPPKVGQGTLLKVGVERHQFLCRFAPKTVKSFVFGQIEVKVKVYKNEKEGNYFGGSKNG